MDLFEKRHESDGGVLIDSQCGSLSGFPREDSDETFSSISKIDYFRLCCDFVITFDI